jgi:hypothetical protein
MEELGEIDKSYSFSAKLVYEVIEGPVNKNLDGRKQEGVSLL